MLFRRAFLFRGFVVVGLFLLSAGLSAQERGAISGRVVTADGEPVSDAVVTVAGTTIRVRAAEDGSFQLSAVPAGTQLLEVSSVRHARGVERVSVIAGETTEVEIVIVSRVHSEQIVVTASPDSRGELDLASPVNILGGDELVARLEPSIGETLAQEAGVSSTYFAPGASRPVIRGLAGDRVKTMENGLDTLDVSTTSPDHAVAVDPLSAERIEVVRGPASLLYGSNAIGGVVNVLDQRIPEFRATEAFSGTIDLRGGSAADERAAAASLNGGGGRWAWHADLQTRETDDYEIPGFASLEGEEHEEEEGEHEEEEEPVFGVLANSDIVSGGGGIGGTYFFGDSGFLGVSVRGLDSEYGIPGGEHEEEHGEEEEGEQEEGHGEEGIRIDMEQRRYDVKGAITRPFGAFRAAKFRLGVVDYEHDELEGPGEVGTSFFNDAWEGRVEIIQKARGSHTGSFGVQIKNRDLNAIGEEAFIPQAETENIGVFTFQELGDGPIRYQFGARWETQDTTVGDPTRPDRSFDGLSGSYGIVWQQSENYSLGASLARSVKMPNSEELYSEGLHFATSAFEQGDATLDEETALGVDLSLRKTAGKVTGAFNLFYNQFSDFIFQRFTGDEIEGFPVLRYSQADADFWGAELDLSIALAQRDHSSWDLDLLWDMVRAEFDDGGDLPRIPPQRFGLGVHHRGDRLRAAAEVRFVGDQNRIAENETPTDGYTLINASVSYRFFFAEQFLDVILRGTNLGDEDARNHISFVKDDVPLPGRNISLAARFSF